MEQDEDRGRSIGGVLAGSSLGIRAITARQEKSFSLAKN